MTDSAGVVRLVLPLPESQNVAPGRHHMAKHRAKNEYRRACWVAAVQQKKPTADPPPKVTVSAHFRVRNLRDDDNLAQSMKNVLDCLKQRQSGKLHWRCGVYEWAGYFVDDNPASLVLAKPTQEIDRDSPRVEIEVRAMAIAA